MSSVLLGICLTAPLTGCSSGAAGASSDASPSATAVSSSAHGPQNLSVNDSVRASLVAAGAKAKNNLPPSAFVGLEKGRTFYARDRDAGGLWAGAALIPSPHSTAAQVAVQDNGSYDLFVRRRDGQWHAYEVGLAGVGGTRCPIQVPAAVLRLWGWPAHSCHPRRH